MLLIKFSPYWRGRLLWPDLQDLRWTLWMCSFLGPPGHIADDKINCGLRYPCSAIITQSQVWQPPWKPSLVLHGQTAARSPFLHQFQRSFMSICKQIQSQMVSSQRLLWGCSQSVIGKLITRQTLSAVPA